jgi:hypothetical protein
LTESSLPAWQPPVRKASVSIPLIVKKEVLMGENWLSNAYEGMSRRQFLARMSAADVGIPAADVKEMEAALKAAGDAWDRCLAWFEKYLRK